MAGKVGVIGVIGAGQMGSGIAQVAAVAGIDVWLHDTDQAALERAGNAVSNSLRRLASKGQIPPEWKKETKGNAERLRGEWGSTSEYMARGPEKTLNQKNRLEAHGLRSSFRKVMSLWQDTDQEEGDWERILLLLEENHQTGVSEALNHLRFTSNLNDLQSADLVIEAIVESEDIKRKLFSELDKITKASCILASNTSSISITRLASQTRRPSQVIGMHFMNPPPIMKLVEIIRGSETSDEVFDTVKALAERVGKVVVCSRDFPGFIVNRILMPMINEAFYALYTGVATPEDIDMGMKLGTNQPIGPLQLADFIGLDVCLAILKVLHDGLGDDKYHPCPLLIQYVDAGRLGKKKGRGVYLYGNQDIMPSSRM